MRLFFTALLIALTAATIGTGAAKDSQSNDKSAVAVPKVTYCELVKHPKKFQDKVVEVSAILEKGFEKSYLYDETGCENTLKKSDTWANYDKSFITEGDSEEAKNNDQISWFGIWRITAVGKFRRGEGPQRFGHLGCCRNEFALMKIVHAERLSIRAGGD